MGVEYLIGSIHWSPLESMGVEDLYGGLMESMGVEELVELVEFVPTYSSTRYLIKKVVVLCFLELSKLEKQKCA